MAVEPQQGALCRQLVRREVARDGREALAQFHTIAPIASVAKRAEPLVGMSLMAAALAVSQQDFVHLWLQLGNERTTGMFPSTAAREDSAP